jgi:hypothetical protein
MPTAETKTRARAEIPDETSKNRTSRCGIRAQHHNKPRWVVYINVSILKNHQVEQKDATAVGPKQYFVSRLNPSQ